MRSQIKQIKALSNTILVQICDEQIFLDFLQTHIKKHFSTTLFLKRSILIFAKDNEKLKRQALLTWLGGMFERSLGLNSARVTPELLKSIHLPINIQLISKNALEGSSQVFISCEKNMLYFRNYNKTHTFFSFLRTYLKAFEITQKRFEIGINLGGKTTAELQIVKKLFSKRIYLTGIQYSLVYSVADLEKFFEALEHNQESTISTASDTLAHLLNEFGCCENEDIKVIKKRYFELAKIYHPDMAHGQDEKTIEDNAQKFIQIKNTYESICKIYVEQGKIAA